MSLSVSEKVEQLITSYAESLGLKIAEVDYSKKTNGMNLTVYIYKQEGSITIEDCEKLHKLIDEPLDQLNPTNNSPYTLNVSSLGLDRPLKTQKDFEINVGKELTVKLYSKDKDGKKVIEGKLERFNESKITLLQQDGNEIEIAIAETAKITRKINI